MRRASVSEHADRRDEIRGQGPHGPRRLKGSAIRDQHANYLQTTAGKEGGESRSRTSGAGRSGRPGAWRHKSQAERARRRDQHPTPPAHEHPGVLWDLSLKRGAVLRRGHHDLLGAGAGAEPHAVDGTLEEQGLAGVRERHEDEALVPLVGRLQRHVEAVEAPLEPRVVDELEDVSDGTPARDVQQREVHRAGAPVGLRLEVVARGGRVFRHRGLAADRAPLAREVQRGHGFRATARASRPPSGLLNGQATRPTVRAAPGGAMRGLSQNGS